MLRSFTSCRRTGLLLAVWTALWCCGMAMPAAMCAEEPASAVGPLLKLFQSGRLPAERQPSVVEMICDRGNDHDLRVIFDKVIQPEGFAADLRLQAVAWLTDAAATRKVKPAGNLAALRDLVVGPAAVENPQLRAAAIRLAAAWKSSELAPALQQIALDDQAPSQLKRAAMTGLVAMADPASRQALEQLAGASQPAAIRMQAVAGLASFDIAAAAEVAANVLADCAPQDDSAQLVNAFLDRKDGADVLAAALAKQELSADVAKRALRHMYSVGRSDQALSDVLSAAAGIAADAPPPTQEEVAQITADVLAKGDPARGERVFRRADLNCTKCHSLNRAGGQVGPDLSAVGGSSPIDYVANSILNPNLAVKEQFATRVFETADGLVLTGVVVDRDDVRVNIRDANGKLVTIPTADIEFEAEGRSLMPQGLTKFLTRDELLDLIRFVSELGKPGPYAVQSAKTIQRWQRLAEPPAELIDDVPHLDHLRQYVLGAGPESWVSAYAQVNGALPLSELVDPQSPQTVLILQGELNVSAGGTIAVSIATDAAVQTWVDTSAFEGKSSFETRLEPGKHVITLRVVAPVGESPLLRVELSTPANSEANFEVVGGA